MASDSVALSAPARPPGSPGSASAGRSARSGPIAASSPASVAGAASCGAGRAPSTRSGASVRALFARGSLPGVRAWASMADVTLRRATR
eukprot:3455198-Lingulodinium_polyedra.AAC.1